MKLFGHDTSPYVRRVRVLLGEMGLPFERDSMSWTAPTDEFLRINPLLRVPVLQLDGGGGGDGQVLLDSRQIAAFLYDLPSSGDAAGDPPLQRTLFHPAHRYDDENVLLCIDGAADSAINLFLLEMDGVSSPYLDRQAQRISRCLSWLDERLAGGPTLHPGLFSFTDIALHCALDWMIFRDRYPVRSHGNLARALDHHRERPVLAATHPSKASHPGPPVTPKK